LVLLAAGIGYVKIRKRNVSRHANIEPSGPVNSAKSGLPLPSPSPPSAKVESPAPPAAQVETLAPQTPPRAIPDDIWLFVQTWGNSFLAGNFDAHMSCYAPVVETYYGKRNLTRAEVRRVREGMVEQYGSVRQFDVSNVELVASAPGRVEVKFRTHWELSGKGYFAGEDMQKLALVQTGGKWVIAGEEEPVVYWVQKQKTGN
jgi:hypothetical protein